MVITSLSDNQNALLNGSVGLCFVSAGEETFLLLLCDAGFVAKPNCLCGLG